MKKQVNILFLVPYPLRQAPSQRFRVELYFPELDKAGVQWKVQSFFDRRAWNSLYQSSNYFKKIGGVLRGYLRRWKIILFGLSKYQFVFIHREAAPLGPPLFEWLLAKIFRKKIIFDFDDAIWIPNTTASNRLAGWMKCFWKVKWICKWSYTVVGGNEYLCDFARRYNTNVLCIPTSVDTENGHNRIKEHTVLAHEVVIGWTGSHSTIKYLDKLVPVLGELEKEILCSFLVISDKAPQFPLSKMQYCPWNEKTETEDLLKIDIGVMPLENDAWSEGKCGFKLIQYLALGIPAVASPVGVNKKIIQHGVNGFLCSTNEEWLQSLKSLAADGSLRTRLGADGRKMIEENYSLKKQFPQFIGLFQ
jgi:glycosyltransferase involved in cell wall biosynthesis